MDEYRNGNQLTEQVTYAAFATAYKCGGSSNNWVAFKKKTQQQHTGTIQMDFS
jgi:hypothetical protein